MRRMTILFDVNKMRVLKEQVIFLKYRHRSEGGISGFSAVARILCAQAKSFLGGNDSRRLMNNVLELNVAI